MIGIIFYFGSEIVEARIDGKNIFFRTSTYGTQFVNIDALHFSKEGVIKEYPDLENDPLWKSKAIERFKESLNGKNENEIVKYVIEDLKKYGYIAKYIQKQGHRVQKVEAKNAN